MQLDSREALCMEYHACKYPCRPGDAGLITQLVLVATVVYMHVHS